MNVLRSHPYACAVAAAAILIVVGAIIVKSHSSLATPAGISAWSGTSGALINSQSTSPQDATSAPASAQSTATSTQEEDDQTLPYTPTSQAETDAQPDADESSSAQLQALLTELSHPSAQTSSSAQSATSSIANAYAYIPTGMVTVEGAAEKNYTPAQEALYNYGNEAGAIIQQEETNDANAPQVLKDSIQSRSDATKSAAVAQIGADIAAVGTRLAKISDAGQASSQNNALAQSYKATGGALQEVAAATNGSDSTFVAALEAYDTTGNTLVKNYVALAVIFSANGVVFAPDDPGAVFSFNEGAGL